VNLSEAFERLLLQVCAESKRIQHLEVFEGCRKECVQESFLRLRVIRKLRKDKAFEIVEGQVQGSCDWKFVRSVVSLHRRWTSSVEEHLVIRRNRQGRNGRSEFSEENSRISVSR
jgi:hypothetical protein